MRTWQDFWITMALGVLFGVLIGWLVRQALTRSHEAELAAIQREIAIADSIHQAHIDSIMHAFAEKELEYDSLQARYLLQQRENQRLDQRNRELQQAYNNIAGKVGAMQPAERLTQVDSLAGADQYPPSAIVDSLPGQPPIQWALVPMPRIDRVLIQMLQNQNLHERVATLERTIVERDGTILTLHSIIINRNEQIERLMVVIAEKDGQITVRNTWIETIGNENKTLRRQLTLTKIGIGALLVLLGIAVSQ